MTLNAVDGMLAWEYGQRSRLGALLNQMGDMVSDTPLYAPSALLLPFGSGGIGAVALLSELTGVLGPAISASTSPPLTMSSDAPSKERANPRLSAASNASWPARFLAISADQPTPSIR